LKKYRDIAVLLSAVSLYSEAYSLVDRLANALSPEVVGKVIYEATRNLDTLIRRGESGVGVFEEEKDGKSFVKVVIEKGGKLEEYVIPGKLPNYYLIEEFLEEAKKDISIARSTAALAMSIVAKAHASKTLEGGK